MIDILLSVIKIITCLVLDKKRNTCVRDDILTTKILYK